MELAIPKLGAGSYYLDWLLERRRRAGQALVSVVAASYLLEVSTRRVDKLVETFGITRLSKSQVLEMARSLDGQVAAFRSRPLDTGPYTFVWLDALTQKVREGGQTMTVPVLIGLGVDADGISGRCLASTSPAAKTAPVGSPFSAFWWPAACPVWRW